MEDEQNLANASRGEGEQVRGCQSEGAADVHKSHDNGRGNTFHDNEGHINHDNDDDDGTNSEEDPEKDSDEDP